MNAALIWLLEAGWTRTGQILQLNQGQPLNEQKCLLCGANATLVEKNRGCNVFCSKECQRLLRGINGQFLDIGKRKRVKIEWVTGGGAGQLTDDALTVMLRWVYQDRIETVEQYNQLRVMRRIGREGKGAQFRRVIDQRVIPEIYFVAEEVLEIITTKELAMFVSLREIIFFPQFSGSVVRRMKRLKWALVRKDANADVDQYLPAVSQSLGELLSKGGVLSGGSIASLTSLTNLSLLDSEISCYSLQSLSRLRRLFLRDHREIIPTLTPLNEQLEELRIHYTEVIDTASLKRFVNLRLLEVVEGETLCTDDSIASLVNLTHLNIQEQRILSDDALVGLTNLTWLSVAQVFTVTEAALRPLVLLRSLSVARTLAFASPFAFLNQENLTALDLSGAANVAGPSLGLLTALTFLNLSAASEGIRDEHISHLTLLRTLILTDNEHFSVEAVVAMTNLTSLSLDSNESFAPIGEDIALLALPLLTALDLTNQSNISDTVVSRMTGLRELDITFNYEITLKTVLSLPNLRFLVADRAGIWDEPDAVDALEARGIEVTLDSNDNHMADMPSGE
jgi:hypothetical protein